MIRSSAKLLGIVGTGNGAPYAGQTPGSNEITRPARRQTEDKMAFTLENTEGFTIEQLAVLNDALETLRLEYPGVGDETLSGWLTNAWSSHVENPFANTAKQLLVRVRNEERKARQAAAISQYEYETQQQHRITGRSDDRAGGENSYF